MALSLTRSSHSRRIQIYPINSALGGARGTWWAGLVSVCMGATCLSRSPSKSPGLPLLRATLTVAALASTVLAWMSDDSMLDDLAQTQVCGAPAAFVSPALRDQTLGTYTRACACRRLPSP
jgi:hypothetical protein